MDTVDVHTPEGGLAVAEPLASPGACRPGEEVERMYASACNKLMAGNPLSAAGTLALIVGQQPWDARFQSTYALALQALGNFDQAAVHHAHALLLEPANAAHALRLAQCLQGVGDMRRAVDALHDCIALCGADVRWRAVRSEAAEALARIACGTADAAPGASPALCH